MQILPPNSFKATARITTNIKNIPWPRSGVINGILCLLLITCGLGCELPVPEPDLAEKWTRLTETKGDTAIIDYCDAMIGGLTYLPAEGKLIQDYGQETTVYLDVSCTRIENDFFRFTVRPEYTDQQDSIFLKVDGNVGYWTLLYGAEMLTTFTPAAYQEILIPCEWEIVDGEYRWYLRRMLEAHFRLDTMYFHDITGDGETEAFVVLRNLDGYAPALRVFADHATSRPRLLTSTYGTLGPFNPDCRPSQPPVLQFSDNRFQINFEACGATHDIQGQYHFGYTDERFQLTRIELYYHDRLDPNATVSSRILLPKHFGTVYIEDMGIYRIEDSLRELIGLEMNAYQ